MNLTEMQGAVYILASLGYGANKLDAFDDAEVNAGIEALNVVRCTSFVPVGPKGRWEINEDPRLPRPVRNGEALLTAFEAAYSTSRYVSAVVAIGLNKGNSKPGIIMEYAKEGVTETDLERIAKETIQSAFQRRQHLGWELEEIITKKIGGLPRERLMVCALAAAILIPIELTGYRA